MEEDNQKNDKGKTKKTILISVLVTILLIFILIIICFIVSKGQALRGSKEVEGTIYKYLNDTYPDETFTIKFKKRKKLNSKDCAFWFDSCIVYEKVPGKYTYIFTGYDSNNIKFKIYYDEEYDNQEVVITDNYRTEKITTNVENIYTNKINKVLSSSGITKVKGTFERTGGIHGENTIEYALNYKIYIHDTSKLEELINNISEKMDELNKNNDSDDYYVYMELYVLQDEKIFDKIKFDNLRFCSMNKDGYHGNYYCLNLGETKKISSKDIMLYYYIKARRWDEDGKVFEPTVYRITTVEK